MKPETRTVNELFERDVRYAVPLYQRPYVWDEDEQWEPLWATCSSSSSTRSAMVAHRPTYSLFLGAIVLEQETQAPGRIPRYTVIACDAPAVAGSLATAGPVATGRGRVSDRRAQPANRSPREPHADVDCHEFRAVKQLLANEAEAPERRKQAPSQCGADYGTSSRVRRGSHRRAHDAPGDAHLQHVAARRLVLMPRRWATQARRPPVASCDSAWRIAHRRLGWPYGTARA